MSKQSISTSQKNFKNQMYKSGWIQVKNIAKKLRKRLIDQTLISKDPPYDPFDIANAFNIDVEYAELSDLSGKLFRVHNQWKIVVPTNCRSTRQRFACAHELGHYLIFQSSEDLLDPLIPFCKVLGNFKIIEEHVCDVFANEFLSPSEELLPQINNSEFDVNAFIKLLKTYQISIQALSIQIIRNSHRYAFVLSSGYTTGKLPWKLRVVWGATPDGYYIPKYQSIQHDSALEQTFKIGSPINVLEKIHLGNIKGSYLVEALPLSDKYATRYVFGLIHLEDSYQISIPFTWENSICNMQETNHTQMLMI